MASLDLQKNKHKLYANQLYENCLHEILIIKGCLIRWNNTSQVSNSLARWIVDNQDYSLHLLDESVEVIKGISDLLDELIENTRVDVTSIKAAIRTLLRSSFNRRERIVALAKVIYLNEACMEEVVQSLKTDLFLKSNELGYPIPLMPLPNKEEIGLIVSGGNGLEDFSRCISIRRLADNLNKGNMIFAKKKFEKDTFEQILALFSCNKLEISNNLIPAKIDLGIERCYRVFGLSKANSGFRFDTYGNFVVDLNNSVA